jgi:hypothetical protein
MSAFVSDNGDYDLMARNPALRRIIQLEVEILLDSYTSDGLFCSSLI